MWGARDDCIRGMPALLEKPEDASLMTVVLQLVEAVTPLPVGVNLGQPRNIYVSLLRSRQGQRGAGGDRGEEEESRNRGVIELGERLNFNVPALLASKMGEGR